VIVVDASVMAPAVGDDGPAGERARSWLQHEDLAAPEVVDLEVLSVLRRAARTGRLDARRSAQALGDLRSMRLHRAPHRPLLPRIWELRPTVTAYDAAYVALAELLDTTLLTADGRLARASGPRCRIELVV